MTVTKILGAQAGIQYQSVVDKSEADPRDSLVNALFTGEFKNGPYNKPFKVTAANIRKALGFDPENLQYQAIEDLLKQGVPFVWVMRVNGGGSSGGGGGGGGSNWSCDTVPKIIQHPNLLPYNGVDYGIYYTYGNQKEIFSTSLPGNTWTLNEGEYIDVSSLIGAIESNIVQLKTETSELQYDQVACKVADSYLPLSLRKGSGYWNNINAGQVKVVIAGSTYFMDYNARLNMNYMYELYDYLVEFFSSLMTFLEGLGLRVDYIPDTTFRDSHATSFNDGYLPRLEIRNTGYGMGGISIEMMNNDNWMLDGYIHGGDCLERYSLNEVYQPQVTSSIRTLQESDRNALPAKIKITLLAKETGNMENLLQHIGVEEDLVFNCCYLPGVPEVS